MTGVTRKLGQWSYNNGNLFVANAAWIESPFGQTRDGKLAILYSATNERGMAVAITDFAAAIVSVSTPDRSGQLADVVLGFPSVTGYETNQHYLGCIVGRYGNRIAQGRFTLHGNVYRLATNVGSHHLHGGIRGWSHVLWRREPTSSDRLVFSHVSPDGDEGYPGKIEASIEYQWNDDGALSMKYGGVSDQATVFNPTNHAYFNLAGHDSGDAMSTVLRIDADHYTPTDESQIPTGKIERVAGTPFDFRAPVSLASRMDADHPQLKLGNGYDHNLVLKSDSTKVALAAVAVDPKSGRQLEVFTSEPGVQLYTANWLMESGKADYGPRQAFCLETQHFPDSPNQPSFPKTSLKPGESFVSETIYRFRVADDADDASSATA